MQACVGGKPDKRVLITELSKWNKSIMSLKLSLRVLAFLRPVQLKQICLELRICPEVKKLVHVRAAKQSWSKRADGDEYTLQPNGPAV